MVVVVVVVVDKKKVSAIGSHSQLWLSPNGE